MHSNPTLPINFLLLAFLCLNLLFSCSENKFDILVKNANIISATSSNHLYNIGINADTIALIEIAQNSNFKGKVEIDAKGKIVSPGFIDPHTHAVEDLDDSLTSTLWPWLYQGVTTVVVGNDGSSPLPIASAIEKWQKHGIGTNVAVLVGHGSIRKQVMNLENRPPSQEELSKMKAILHQSIAEGAIGLSTGLYYVPGAFAATDEVIELAKLVSKEGLIYDTHIRDESNYNIGLLNSIRENIVIGRESGVKVHISHIKALGVDLWGSSDQVVALIDSARAKGINITANQYPFTASGTSLSAAVFPSWAREGGKDEMQAKLSIPEIRAKILNEMVENIRRRGGPNSFLTTRSENKMLLGRTLEDIANTNHATPAEAALEIIENGDAKIASFNMSDDDINNFMKQSWVVTGSDGSSGHPRKYATFAKKIRKYVVEDSIITLQHFIQNSTVLTADIFGFEKRGKIAVGYYADLIVFDPIAVKDKADFAQPEQFSEGMNYVLVNGKIVIENNQPLEIRAGKILTKK